MNMKTDKDTGLPELPEGCFWRVEPWYGYDTETPRYLEVHLKRRATRKNWRGKKIEYEYSLGNLNLRWSELVEATAKERRHNIRLVAQEVYQMVSWQLANGRERIDIESLIGDYPPKKLEA